MSERRQRRLRKGVGVARSLLAGGAALAIAALALPAAADCMNSCMTDHACGLAYEAGRVEGDCYRFQDDCETLCRRQSPAYGAIAYGRQSGAAGWSYSQADSASAERLALGFCAKSGPDCEIALSFADSCGAVAAAPDDIVATARAGSKEAAQADALEACQNQGGADCEVVAWVCSFR